jgi:hypothetical protein
MRSRTLARGLKDAPSSAVEIWVFESQLFRVGFARCRQRVERTRRWLEVAGRRSLKIRQCHCRRRFLCHALWQHGGRRRGRQLDGRRGGRCWSSEHHEDHLARVTRDSVLLLATITAQSETGARCCHNPSVPDAVSVLGLQQAQRFTVSRALASKMIARLSSPWCAGTARRASRGVPHRLRCDPHPARCTLTAGR